jgi:hypothetical protein
MCKKDEKLKLSETSDSHWSADDHMITYVAAVVTPQLLSF